MNVKLHVSFFFSYLLSSWQNLEKTYIVRKGICRCNMQCKYSMNTEAMPNSWGLSIKIEPDFWFSVVNIWKVQKINSPSFTQSTRHKIRTLWQKWDIWSFFIIGVLLWGVYMCKGTFNQRSIWSYLQLQYFNLVWFTFEDISTKVARHFNIHNSWF